MGSPKFHNHAKRDTPTSPGRCWRCDIDSLNLAREALATIPGQDAILDHITTSDTAPEPTPETSSLREALTTVAEGRDVPFPDKFKFEASENYILGWRALQSRIQSILRAEA